jgi:ribulose-phosphate 3-epimerase
MIDKIRRVRAMIGERPIELEVDGGIGAANAGEIAAAGANVFVAGSSIFGGRGYAGEIASLRNAARTGRGEK